MPGQLPAPSDEGDATTVLRPGPSTVSIPGSNPTLLWARARR